MVDSIEHVIEVDGAALSVLDQGPIDGPCILMAHSVLTDRAMWDAQVPALLAQGWRVLRPDSRGHGSSTSGGTDITIDRLALDIVAILDALDVRQIHFVGLSLGGIVGFSLATQHSQRLASLVLCDARAEASLDFAAPWPARIEQAQQAGVAALADATLQRWFADRPLAIQARDAIESAIVATSLEGFVGTAKALQHFDYTAKLARICVPTCLIVGELDGPLPAAMAAAQGSIPGSSLVTIPGAGHLPNVEAATSFNTAMLGHLAAHR